MGIINYFKETKTELTHVNWPSRRQSIIFSVVVAIVSLVLAFFLGIFDLVFSKLMGLVV